MNRPERTRFEYIFRFALLGFACVITLLSIVHSIHWQLTADPSVLHYGSFLISQGKIPYRDVIEPDLPAAYMMEGFVIHVFGGGDLAWRLYDLFLLAALNVACITIARPYDWLAGLFAGLSFVLFHLEDGPHDLGQRELFVAVCLIVALAFLFRASRSRKPWPMLLFGFFIGAASSVKPPACLFGVLALLMLFVALRRSQIAIVRYAAFALLGFFVAASFTLLFFLHYHDFRDFLVVERLLIPYYEKIGSQPLFTLARWMPRELKLLLPMGVLFTLLLYRYKASWTENWERAVLFVGACCGLLTFFVQHKYFPHHLSTFIAFSLLYFSMEAFKALRGSRFVCLAGAAALVVAAAVLGGKASRVVPYTDPVTPAMMADLIRLGGANLNNRVQCLDGTVACQSSLYRLKLSEHVAYLNDFFLIGPPGSQPIPQFRQHFLNDLQTHPPDVILVTNQPFFAPVGFDKLKEWPEFASLLDSQYFLETTRNFGLDAYRIYRRKGLPLTAMSAPEPLTKTAP